MQKTRKGLDWEGSAKEDLLSMPTEVIKHMGYALDVAQLGGIHDSAKPLKGMGNTRIVEIKKKNDGNTYRCIYTTLFPQAICVLHCFQKKSTIGIKMQKNDEIIINARLTKAKKEYL